MNIGSDGVFIIKKGQGLTQAIAQEVGLNDEQTQKLGASIWTNIIGEIDKQKAITPDLYKGGNNINGAYNKNFVVQSEQVVRIDLSKIWSNILNIINSALGTNFTVLNNEANKKSDIPSFNPQLAEQYRNETPKPELAGQQIVVGDKTYDYDKNGYVRAIFSDGKPQTVISRNNNNEIEAINTIAYDKSGLMHNISYDKDGNVKSYLDGNIRRDGSGKIIEVSISQNINNVNICRVFKLENSSDAEEIAQLLLMHDGENTVTPSSDSHIAEQYRNETPKPELAGQQIVVGDKTYDYDKNGYVRAIFSDSKPQTVISRNNNNEIEAINTIAYDKSGLMHNISYDKDGNVKSYLDGDIRRDADGQIIGISNDKGLVYSL